mmetsp:Transcript_9575/g.19233  ORF Transcript_9575/g.19233 Transcript_9575/m.19233 type:complete len:226 (-) Transcript_9575:437-1114(-)
MRPVRFGSNRPQMVSARVLASSLRFFSWHMTAMNSSKSTVPPPSASMTWKSRSVSWSSARVPVARMSARNFSLSSSPVPSVSASLNRSSHCWTTSRLSIFIFLPFSGPSRPVLLKALSGLRLASKLVRPVTALKTPEPCASLLMFSSEPERLKLRLSLPLEPVRVRSVLLRRKESVDTRGGPSAGRVLSSMALWSSSSRFLMPSMRVARVRRAPKSFTVRFSRAF